MKPISYSPNHWLEFLRLNDNQLLKATKIDVHKSSGKGGQKKNKVENAIRLTLGKIQVTESASRSKEENIAGALKKLKVTIALDYLVGSEVRQLMKDPPKEILPYIGAGEIRVNPKNPVYPIFLGWFMDRYLAHFGDFPALAVEVGASKSQIKKFIERNTILKRVTEEANEFMFLLKALSGGKLD